MEEFYTLQSGISRDIIKSLHTPLGVFLSALLIGSGQPFVSAASWNTWRATPEEPLALKY